MFDKHIKWNGLNRILNFMYWTKIKEKQLERKLKAEAQIN